MAEHVPFEREEQKYEEVFRDALIKYMEQIKFSTPGSYLTDFLILTVERDMTEPNKATTAYIPYSGSLHVTQMGMLRYVGRLMDMRIGRSDTLDDDDDE